MKVKKTFEFNITEEKIKLLLLDAADDAIDIIFNGGGWRGKGHWPYCRELADKHSAINLIIETMLDDIVNGNGKVKPVEYSEQSEEIL